MISSRAFLCVVVAWVGSVSLMAAPPVDSDSDGMSDAWEQVVFGNLDATAEGNPDGDLFSNYHEYVYGTDPFTAERDSVFVPDFGAPISEIGLYYWGPVLQTGVTIGTRWFIPTVQPNPSLYGTLNRYYTLQFWVIDEESAPEGFTPGQWYDSIADNIPSQDGPIDYQSTNFVPDAFFYRLKVELIDEDAP